MGHRGAERPGGGPAWIGVDPLLVQSGIGKGLDLVLDQGVPAAHPDFLSRHACKLGGIFEQSHLNPFQQHGDALASLLPGDLGVKVGLDFTQAQFRIEAPQYVSELLEALLRERKRALGL